MGLDYVEKERRVIANIMGCGFSETSATVRDPTSPDFHGNVNRLNFGRTGTRPTETMIEAFTRLDAEILATENLSPGSRLTTAEAWVEHLENMQLRIDDTRSDKASLDVISEIDDSLLDEEKLPPSAMERERNDIVKVKKLAVKLQVATDVKKASEQEEFLARISRGVMEIDAERLKNDMIEHGKKRVETLIDSYNRLRDLYLEQDGLIASISGGTYSSSLEQDLDAELETAREVRDRLSGVAEQWRTSSNLLRAASKGALQAYECWSLASPQKSPTDRIQIALDTRALCQSSLVALDCAQQALPQVEIPFVTQRQSSAVKHALIYLLTDMANDSRYTHTKNVLDSYQSNTMKAVDWIHTTYKKSLDEDLTAQIEIITNLTFRLRKERIRHFKTIVGNKIYSHPMIKTPELGV